MISVAAGGVYSQEYHQEDDDDDANHAAFGHAAAAHFDQREIWESQDDLTESIANIFTVASNTFLLAWLKSMVQGVGGHIPDCSPMVTLNVAGMEEPLALTAVTSSW